LNYEQPPGSDQFQIEMEKEKKSMQFQIQTFFEAQPISPSCFCSFWANKINKVEFCTQIILYTTLEQNIVCWSHIPFVMLFYCTSENCMGSNEEDQEQKQKFKLLAKPLWLPHNCNKVNALQQHTLYMLGGIYSGGNWPYVRTSLTNGLGKVLEVYQLRFG
jgi:hypothetical protein